MHILTLPTGPLADAGLALVRSSESHLIVDHSIRSFLFARIVAEHEGCLTDAAYDEQLLFAATVMHDLDSANTHEVRLASRSRAPTWSPPFSGTTASTKRDVDRVERSPSTPCVGIADRRGLLT